MQNRALRKGPSGIVRDAPRKHESASRPIRQRTPSTAAPESLLRTLVLCDLVDCTALVERLGDRKGAAFMQQHDRFARDLVHVIGGREIDKTDGFLLMFERPIQAVAFALAYQRAAAPSRRDANSCR